MTGGDDTALRADARRNREQILTAARVLFGQRGADVPLEEVARAAGVGVGTLYRRFPDRDELIRAVSVDSFERLRAVAHEIEERQANPDVALSDLLRSTLDLRLGLTLSVLSPGSRDAMIKSPAVVEVRAELLEVLGRIVRRAQDAGSLRPDVAAGDVLLAVISLARLVPPDDDELGEMVLDRLFVLIFDGLRANPGSPLPGRPVTTDDLDTLRESGVLGGYRGK